MCCVPISSLVPILWRLALFIFLFLASSMTSSSLSFSPSKPHPHHGLLPSFSLGIQLNEQPSAVGGIHPFSSPCLLDQGRNTERVI